MDGLEGESQGVSCLSYLKVSDNMLVMTVEKLKSVTLSLTPVFLQPRHIFNGDRTKLELVLFPNKI